MKNKILVVISILSVSLIALFYFNNHKKQILNDKVTSVKIEPQSKQNVLNKTSNIEVVTEKDQNSNLLNQSFKWSDLDIKPIKSLEGSNYTLTAFEVIDNNLVITGNYNNKNIVRFINNNKMLDLEIQDTPLDLLYNDKKLYVLCFNSIQIIENKQLTQTIPINIPNITTYDKLMFFDNTINLLMSDGSSYQLINNNLTKHSALKTKNNIELWVQKTTNNSFAIKTKPNTQSLNHLRKYNKNIGAITLIGNSSENYYCVIEIIENTRPINIKRIVSSNKDQFGEVQLTLPQQNYSYIKNDYKFHNNILFIVSINETGVKLNSYRL